MTKQKPEILEKRYLAQGRLFDIEEMDLKFSNGEERQFVRINSRAPAAVLVVPLLDENTILLIREYGAGIDDYSLGFPKGAIASGEDPLDGANRELKEEVGYGARRLSLIKTFSTSPSYMSARMHYVVAQDLYEERLPGDEPEILEVVPWKLDNIDALLARDDFHEARSIAALLMLSRGDAVG
jgi:ADP-ribose diphosphatase